MDYSTTVFVLTGKVEVTETAYYTSLSFTSDGQKITLYCSSANQYAFLKQFSGKEITLEVAACNWNDKTFWAGCALAVYTEDGKKKADADVSVYAAAAQTFLTNEINDVKKNWQNYKDSAGL